MRKSDIPLNGETQRILQRSYEAARRLNHRKISSEHLLLGMLDSNDPVITMLFKAMQVQQEKVRRAVEFVIGRDQRLNIVEPIFSEDIQLILDMSKEEARTFKSAEVRPEHVFIGMMREPQGTASQILENYDITPDITRDHLMRLRIQGNETNPYAVAYTQQYQQTPTLNLVSRDLTAAAIAGQLDPVIGREYEIERAMQVLSRRTKNNPVLIGEAGVGKTAIAEGLAQRIVQGNVPDFLKSMRVVALDTGLLTIGTKYRGDFEERLKKLLAEIVAVKNLIIVVDELHTLIGAGVAEGSVDAANLLKPILARGDFRCMGTTTLDDFRKTIERDPALERRFQKILVRETTLDETVDILKGLRERYEVYHHVKITDAALRSAAVLSDRYISSRQLPDKAVDLIDEASARLSVGRSVRPASIRVQREKLDRIRDEKNAAIDAEDFPLATMFWRQEKRLREELTVAERAWYDSHSSEDTPIVDTEQIATVVANATGIPVAQMTLEETQRLLHLEDDLHQRVIGQDAAVQAIARAIRRSRTELRDRRRPIGSFVFAGPTGVGKTELARTLAATLFGDEDALITFDMSEFMDAHFAARLVGAPPGYIGYDQAGQLTEAVKRKPYSVVLFDEIEKAHPRVYDLLLQILEDGRIADAKGKEIDFRNTIIILTTNAGAREINGRGPMSLQHGREQDRLQELLSHQVHAALKEVFRPELLNRLDDIIVFQPLAHAQIRQIADIMLARITGRVEALNLRLRVSEDARDHLARLGYDREYGARPMRRILQQQIEDVLAERVLRGEFPVGSQVEIGLKDGTLQLDAHLPIPVSSDVLPEYGASA